MRITILLGPFLPVPPLQGGACEKLWYRLGQEFAHLGHDVVSISRCFPSLPDEETVDGVRYRRIKSYQAAKFGPLNLLKDVRYNLNVRRVLPEADILLSHTPPARTARRPRTLDSRPATDCVVSASRRVS